MRARTDDFMRRMNAERDARRDARTQSLMEEIIAEMPEEHTQPNGRKSRIQDFSPTHSHRKGSRNSHAKSRQMKSKRG